MREFAKFPPQFWMSSLYKKIKFCDAETKIIAFYLMTCPNSNMIGFYYLPLVLLAHETGCSLEEALKGLRSLTEVGFCAYDEHTDYVWIYEMASVQTGAPLKTKDNKVKHANELFQQLPETSFLTEFYEKYRDLLHLELHPREKVIKPPLKPLQSPFEVSEKREKRSEKIEVISNKEDLSISLGGQQTKLADDEEEFSVKNLITFPVKTKNSVVFTIPLRQGGKRIIEESEVDEWQKNYPDVNVRQEIRKLIAWNQANPDRQKTERGINRHIQGWLAHAKKLNVKSVQPTSTWDHNVAVINALLEEDNGR